MADWYPTYLLRYTGATVDGAGLLVGAATVLGGIGGSIIGRGGVCVRDVCEERREEKRDEGVREEKRRGVEWSGVKE